MFGGLPGWCDDKSILAPSACMKKSRNFSRIVKFGRSGTANRMQSEPIRVGYVRPTRISGPEAAK